MSEHEARLGDALRAAGPREAPDAVTMARLRAAAHAAWQAELTRRRRWRWAGVAATMLLAVGIAAPFVLRGPSQPAPAIAQVFSADTGASIVRDSRSTAVLGANSLGADDELRTAGQAIELRRTGDGAGGIRVAAGSRVVLRDAGQLELLAGEVYVDTRASGIAAAPLRIVAGAARIQHIGTQFIVRRKADAVQVAVRDGRVRIDMGAANAELVRGESAAFSSAGGDLRRGSLAPDDPAWRWVEALAPSLMLEGRDLRSVLEVLSRESGRRLRFASGEVEADVAATVLHGPPLELPPSQALDTLLATTGFAALPGEPGELVIAAR